MAPIAILALAASVLLPAQDINPVDFHLSAELHRRAVEPAPPASDYQFLRRVYLDLTGRIPTPTQIRDFLETGSNRNALVRHLLDSSEFSDKWSMWTGDWLQNTRVTVYGNPVATRNQFHRWIRDEVRGRRSLREIAEAVLTADLDSAYGQTGSFLASVEVNTGPKEDGWDNMLSKSATVFLGLGHYECLLCHNGRGHLGSVSLWATRTTRLDAQRMAAFFTNTFSYPGLEISEPTALQYYQTPGYSMQTDFGNRPTRQHTAPDAAILTPAYRENGAKPAGYPETWRRAFATQLLADPMFARNLANRLWKQLFGVALAEPLDALDPDRLDPAHPPPDPWALQASHPELLEALAQHLRDSDFDLRDFLYLLATSDAYQRSSDPLPADPTLQARHLPRRLDAEEVHDAIVTATGILPNYTIEGMPDQDPPLHWAMQLPDTAEPETDPAAKSFLDAFYRGDRLDAKRNGAPSLLQAMKLLNDPFVLRRLDASQSPVLGAIAAIPDPEQRIREMFLTFLSRPPSETELRDLVSLSPSLVDLAWALINKTEFLYCP